MKHLWKFAAIAVLFAMTSSVNAGLIGYWPFDDALDSETAADASGNGNDGVLVATAEVPILPVFVEAGKIGGAIDFGEADNGAFVNLPTAADGAFGSIVDSQSATISFWMNRGGPASSQWTFALDGGDASGDAVTGRQLSGHAPWGNGIVYFDTGGCCDGTQRLNGDLPAAAIDGGEWVHMAFVRDFDDTMIYLDGELLYASPADSITSPISPIIRASIGAAGDGANSQLGLIDDFAIWDNALSAEWIGGLADGTRVVPEPGSFTLMGLAVFGLLRIRRQR